MAKKGDLFRYVVSGSQISSNVWITMTIAALDDGIDCPLQQDHAGDYHRGRHPGQRCGGCLTKKLYKGIVVDVELSREMPRMRHDHPWEVTSTWCLDNKQVYEPIEPEEEI